MLQLPKQYNKYGFGSRDPKTSNSRMMLNKQFSGWNTNERIETKVVKFLSNSAY